MLICSYLIELYVQRYMEKEFNESFLDLIAQHLLNRKFGRKMEILYLETCLINQLISKKIFTSSLSIGVKP